jgi:hypothetical protein
VSELRRDALKELSCGEKFSQRAERMVWQYFEDFPMAKLTYASKANVSLAKVSIFSWRKRRY